MMKTFSLLGAVFAATLTFTAEAYADDIAAGQRLFNKCKACHTVEQGGRNRVGPNLWGFFGREAATAEGFTRYSKAMKESGIVWDDENLDAYLENPRKALKGTNMAFVGIRNAEQRAQLIAYLKKVTTAAE